MLNHIIAESIRKDLARKRRDSDASGLALEDVAEVFEVGVAATDRGVTQLEGGDVGAALDFVRCVHGATGAVGAWILDLVVTG